MNNAELQIWISAKLKQFSVSVKQKTQKIIINSIKSSTKPAGTDCPSVGSTPCSSKMTSQVLTHKRSILFNFLIIIFFSFLVIKFISTIDQYKYNKLMLYVLPLAMITPKCMINISFMQVPKASSGIYFMSFACFRYIKQLL